MPWGLSIASILFDSYKTETGSSSGDCEVVCAERHDDRAENSRAKPPATKGARAKRRMKKETDSFEQQKKLLLLDFIVVCISLQHGREAEIREIGDGHLACTMMMMMRCDDA